MSSPHEDHENASCPYWSWATSAYEDHENAWAEQHRRLVRTSADIMQQRHDKIEAFKVFFINNLIEDPKDWTDFDRAVFDAFKTLHTKFCPPEQLKEPK